MTPEEVKNLLKRQRISPNKTYGQNFLLNEDILTAAVEAAGVKAGDRVLEIGPGLGILTKQLLDRGAFVLAIEKDPAFLPVLKKLKKDYRDLLRYEIADILNFDFQTAWANWPKGIFDQGEDGQRVSLTYKVVANIPYYITGKIIYLLLQAKQKPSSITVLIQKEVAENIVAKPGQLNILAISVQLYGVPRIERIVPAADFFPAPKVDSALLHIAVSPQPRFAVKDERQLFRVIKACFAGKRKQLHNTLVNNLAIDKNVAAQILQKLKINPAARPQELTIEDWIGLTDELDLSAKRKAKSYSVKFKALEF